MPRYDLSPAELRAYQSAVEAPEDLAAFWHQTLVETRAHPLAMRAVPADAGLALIDAYDVTFAGFGGDPVKAWLLLPKGLDGKLPGVVKYIGYGGGRGQPHDHLFWPAAGFATLVMDTRGQGSVWSQSDTADPGEGAPAAPGYLTRGILSPHTYYYRRLYADTARAVEALRQVDRVDPARIAVTGGSQGGGLAVAAAYLDPTIAACMPDVPALCDFPRAIEVALRDPYLEIVRYLAVHHEQVGPALETLRYFDGAVLARDIRMPALFSIALMDPVVPPSTSFAAFNAYAGADKTVAEYPYNEHEGGGAFHLRRQLDWLRARLG